MTLFLVGHERSAKTNSWLAITPFKEEAEKFMAETPEAVTIKEVVVPQRGQKRRKRK